MKKYTIRELSTSHDLEDTDYHLASAVIDSRAETFQGQPINDIWKQNFKQWVYKRMRFLDYHYFGAFEKDKLVAFIGFYEWPNDDENYKMESMYSIPGLPKSEGNARPDAMIQIVNHAVKFFEDRGRKYLWTLTSVDSTERLFGGKGQNTGINKDCVLSEYKVTEIEDFGNDEKLHAMVPKSGVIPYNNDQHVPGLGKQIARRFENESPIPAKKAKRKRLAANT